MFLTTTLILALCINTTPSQAKLGTLTGVIRWDKNLGKPSAAQPFLLTAQIHIYGSPKLEPVEVPLTGSLTERAAGYEYTYQATGLPCNVALINTRVTLRKGVRLGNGAMSWQAMPHEWSGSLRILTNPPKPIDDKERRQVCQILSYGPHHYKRYWETVNQREESCINGMDFDLLPRIVFNNQPCAVCAQIQRKK